MRGRRRLAAFSLCIAIATSLAHAQDSLPAEKAPDASFETDATRTAMQALARGQRAVTVAVPVEPLPGLQERLNRLHLRLGLLGWQFAAQEFVSDHTGNGVLLLSYRR